jgi:L-fucose isomerase-like protein
VIEIKSGELRMKQFTMGVIFGNRDFFPDQLITEARADIEALFTEMDARGIWLGEQDSKLGSVETYADARKCADLFQAHRREIDGILVCLPNFGDEKGVADTLKFAELNVPVLVQAYPDDLDAFNVERRRDAFCGKVSVCNNLRQYGFRYSLTDLHTSHPLSDGFKQDLRKFMGACRVVNGLRNARLGAVGARPNAFNTTRYSEKLLQ